MSMIVGFPAVYDEETKIWEDVYIRTKASEIIFDDGQTLDFKVKDGQFDGKQGVNGVDGITTTITVPGATDWIRIPVGINLTTGGHYLTRYTEEGAQFIFLEFTAEDMIKYDCYGYWLKAGNTGAGIITSWKPSYGIWQLFTESDGSLKSVRVYPNDIEWCNAGFVSEVKGGDIINSKTKEGFNYLTATVNGIPGTGYWLKRKGLNNSDDFGTGILFGNDGLVRCLRKEGFQLKYTTLKNYDEVKNPSAVQPVASWFDLGTITEVRNVSLAINSKTQEQGLYLIKFTYNRHDYYGLWLQWNKSGAGFVFDSDKYANGYYPCFVIDANGRFVEVPQKNKSPQEETTVFASGTAAVITGILKDSIPVGLGAPIQITYNDISIKGRFFRHDKNYGTGIGTDSRGIAYHIHMYGQFFYMSVT